MSNTRAQRVTQFLLISAVLLLSALGRAGAQTTPDSLVNEAIYVVEANRLSAERAPDWRAAVTNARESNPNTLTLARVVIRTLLKSAPSAAARFLSPEELDYFLVELTGESHMGVGLIEMLSVDEDRARGGLVVITPVPGTSAGRVLRPGDRIERIGDHATKDFSLSQNMMFLRGDSGSTVQVTVRRGEALQRLSLKRDRVVPPRVTSRAVAAGTDSVLYVRIGQFTQGSAAAFLAALDAAAQRELAGIVIDLRNNPGGLLAEAQQVLGGLLGPVAIGSTEGRTGRTALNAQGNRRTNLPVAVLVNRGTASAAELVASALADTKAAVVVGERTVGKGLVNSAFALSDSSVLMVGTGRLVTAGGKQILRTGVLPTLPVAGPSPWTNEAIKPASPQDIQFQRAVAAVKQKR